MVIEQDPGDDYQADLIGKLLKELQVDMQELLALKIDAGYFEEIVDLALHFQPAVGQLQHDHEQLLAELESMQVEAHEPDHLPRIGRLLHGWLSRFRELDLREIELIQNVWNVDVGTID